MATSISKAQADAIASGFFNKYLSEERVSDHFIRTDVGLVPKATFSKLIQLAGYLIVAMQDNLNKAGRIGRGDLSESMKILNPAVVNGVTMSVSIEALFYWKFIDGGVKGTKSGSGVFSFKNDFVGKKMLKAIQRWVKEEGIRGKADTKYRIPGKEFKRENFRKSISANSAKENKSLAWAIAKSIKQKGLKQTRFVGNAIKTVTPMIDEELKAALVIDVIRSLPKKL